MKTKITLGVYLLTFLLSMFPHAVDSMGTRPMISALPSPYPQGGFFPPMPYFSGVPGVSFPQASRYPLISAQQACLQEGGWNWRQGHMPMCFKPGHDICPSGHPWMRQMTQRFTICLSANQPGQLPPEMGIR